MIEEKFRDVLEKVKGWIKPPSDPGSPPRPQPPPPEPAAKRPKDISTRRGKRK